MIHVTVYVWYQDVKMRSLGHVSLEVDKTTYISWYPLNNKTKFSKIVNINTPLI